MYPVLVLRWLYPLLLFFLIQATACGTAKSAYETATKSLKNTMIRDRSGLSKRVLIIPMLNYARLNDEKVAHMTDVLIGHLKKGKNIIIHKMDEPLPSTEKLGSPRVGIIVDPELAKRAEEMGMNAMITTMLNPMEYIIERSGFWPIRKVKREMEVSILVNAVDIMNGTLLLSHLETRSVKMPKEDEEESKTEKRISDQELDKIISSILEDLASAIINSLKSEPWSGRVLSANEKTIIINAGRDVGLNRDRVFEVFTRGAPISSASGRPLFLLGPKVGEIKVLEIMESFASAVPMTKGDYKAGQVIRIKN